MNTYSRFLGGIFLIAGTSIGAGMLALPVTASFGGFIPSCFVFLIIWGLMLFTAYFFLDVNLEMRGEPNFISMAEKTLGQIGKFVSWIFYLLLLYSLLGAYLAACSPLFSLAFSSVFGIPLPSFLAPFALPVLFGGFIYLGTIGVDYINRILMLGLIISYFLLVGALPEHIEAARLLHVDFKASLLAIPVVVTSFGYHIIIPTLTTYLAHDRKKLRKILFIGSVIPFVVYLFWQWIVLGAVPFENLVGAWHQGLPATEPLAQSLEAPWIGSVARFFSFFAIITSFLGVSLSLSDFLIDGLKIKKSWEGRLTAIALTFVPPLVFVFSYQKGFYIALEYAGVFVSVLLGIIPALMVLKLKTHPWYRRPIGKICAITVVILFSGIILLNLLEKGGWFKSIIAPYL